MSPVILVFNIPADKLSKLRFTCMRLGIQVRPVEAAEYGQPIGALCGMAPRTDDTIQHYPLPPVESDVKDYYRNIKKAIRGEEKQLVTHPQMMRVMRLMEAMMLSAERNEVIHSRI